MSNLKERLKERIELSAESGCGDMPCCIDEMEAAIKEIERLTTEASCAAHNAAEYHDIIRGQRERIAKLEADLDKYKTGAWSNAYCVDYFEQGTGGEEK